jgi:YfiH family protein
MIKKEERGILYCQFESLLSPELFHGVFSRMGGVSPAPWESLNLGGTVGDSRENVSENLKRLLAVSGFTHDQLVQVRQIHSNDVIFAKTPEDAERKGDAIVTNRPGLLLLMRFADCVPVLFFDPVKRAIGIAHAGWMGTLNGVVVEVIHKMVSEFGSSPDQINVGIGPSIGPDHYLIGTDVIEKAKRAFPDKFEQVLIEDSDGVKLDLWRANEFLMEEVGIEQIEIAGICTGCDTQNWFSHRAENGKTGRFAGVIGLR